MVTFTLTFAFTALVRLLIVKVIRVRLGLRVINQVLVNLLG